MSGVKRVVLFGPESTGKSTLAERLAVRFGAPWSGEFVREFWDRRGGVIEATDLDEIGRGQVAGEEEAVARAEQAGSRVVFHDTDLLTCRLWDDLLFPGACPDWVREEGDRRARGMGLYLFCDTDLPWAPDPQRCFPDEAGRAMCRALWVRTLTELGLSAVVVAGSEAERERVAVEAVERLLGQGFGT